LYVKKRALVLNVKKTTCAAVDRHRYVDDVFFVDEQVVTLSTWVCTLSVEIVLI